MTNEELMKEFNLGIYSIMRWKRIAHSNDPDVIRECMKEREILHRERMSTSAKKRANSAEGRKHLLSIASHPISEETRKKISISGRGRVVTEETRKRMSIAFKGRKLTDETKKKLSHSQRERISRMHNEIKDYCESHNLITSKDAADILNCGKTTFERIFRNEIAHVIKNTNLYKQDTLNRFPEIMKSHHSKSRQEKEIAAYFENVVVNTRKIIPPKELDIYFPEKKVAVEFNGLYYHSTAHGCDKNKHIEKTIMCEKNNIRLIHIFEDEWVEKKEIVLSIINAAIGKFNQVIYARNCEFRELDKETVREFFNKNHMNGNVHFSSAFGLFYHNTLVQAASFGKSRFKKGEIELLRMATVLNTQVVGGFSKIMKHQPYDNVISYVDRRLFNSSGYSASDWKLISTTAPSYYYTDLVARFNRMNYTKKKCIEMWGPSSLTEEQMCEEHRLFRVYDCGCFKLSWKR